MLSLLILYFIVPSIMCDDCNGARINVKGGEIVQVLGDNKPMTSKTIDSDAYICWNAELLTLNKCKIGTVEHCGLLFGDNDCGDTLGHARDFYTFNNGDTILFGGIVSVHPMIDGSDGSDIWDFASSSFATADNIIDSSGEYKNVKGRRSLRGFVKINTDQTRGSINEYHTLHLRTDSKKKTSIKADFALMDINNKDKLNYSDNNVHNVVIDMNRLTMYCFFGLMIGLMICGLIFYCYHKKRFTSFMTHTDSMEQLPNI